MKFPLSLPLFLSVIVFAACKKSEHAVSPDTAAESSSQTITKSDVAETLDPNQQKWAVNEEMKPFIHGGRMAVEKFLSDHGTDYAELAQELKKQNNGLIQACTMEGDAHEALHQWLHPQLKRVSALAKENDPGKASQLVQDIDAAYRSYDGLFR